MNMQKEMSFFYRTHDHLIRNLGKSVRRGLMDQIDWNDRLIGIKGSRGIGKTTFLLDIARERYGFGNDECLYLNLNQFCFTTSGLCDFAAEFVNKGGRTLLLDQVFKLPGWATELRECIDRHPELNIIFTGSSVIRLDQEGADISGSCASYTLNGFSLREFVNLMTGLDLKALTLDEILENHAEITQSIIKQVRPNEFLQDYLHHGYYPFFLEKRNYSENLLKMINMMLEVDVLFIRQIEQRCLHKLRKLFYLLASKAPTPINITQLAQDIETSRATATNYLSYLSEAKLLNLIYKTNEENMKKPAACFLNNTNIGYVMAPDPQIMTDMYKTFFLNQLQPFCDVSIGNRSQITFTINKEHHFRIDVNPTGRYKKDRQYVVRNMDTSTRGLIPLWLFGFLY